MGKMRLLLLLFLFMFISCTDKKTSMTEAQFKEWCEENNIQNPKVKDEYGANCKTETKTPIVTPTSRQKGLTKEFIEYEKNINEKYKPKSLYE